MLYNSGFDRDQEMIIIETHGNNFHNDFTFFESLFVHIWFTLILLDSSQPLEFICEFRSTFF